MTTRTETHQLPLRLPVEDYEDLRDLAHFTDRSMNQIVTAVLHEYLEGPGHDELVRAVTNRARIDYRVLLDKLADS